MANPQPEAKENPALDNGQQPVLNEQIGLEVIQHPETNDQLATEINQQPTPNEQIGPQVTQHLDTNEQLAPEIRQKPTPNDRQQPELNEQFAPGITKETIQLQSAIHGARHTLESLPIQDVKPADIVPYLKVQQKA